MLKDTTYTMIVRDEILNPAGGLYNVLIRTIPNFEQTVILDTGSVDGTRELLEELTSQYPTLHVYDHPFEGYGPSRNRAKKLVQTKYSFCGDADELLPDISVRLLKRELTADPEIAHLITHIRSPQHGTKELELSGGWNPRFHTVKDVRFRKECFEYLHIKEGSDRLPRLVDSIILLHFKPANGNYLLKNEKWYNHLRKHMVENNSPSSIEGYIDWKLPDPTILIDYGIDMKNTYQQLKQMQIPIPEHIQAEFQSLAEYTGDRSYHINRRKHQLRLAAKNILETLANSAKNSIFT